MSLTPPTLTELENWRDEALVPREEPGVTRHLQAATDLFETATSLHTDPTDALQLRVMKRAILDMTWYIGTSMEDRDAQFSPFSSERIGSYSYSKAQRSVDLGGQTGIPFFDLGVAFFQDLNTETDTALAWASSTHVMADTLIDSVRPEALTAPYGEYLDYLGGSI